jgi:hypothetical protein
MDESVRKAMEKWPEVPALYGWLRLDATGRWHLKGEPITHRGLIDFINRNYQPDEHGRWYFQNGPQRGYVSLDYTPWILHIDSAGQLRTHTGDTATPADRAAIDDQGNLLIDTTSGAGLLDPDALPIVSEWLTDARGAPASDNALEAVMAGDDRDTIHLNIDGRHLPLQRIPRAEVPARFGFISRPRPDDNDDNSAPA